MSKNKSSRDERKMNVHFRRFVEFMRYLKEKEAKIVIKQKDECSGETFSDTYSYDEKDIPIVDLIAEACDIRGSLASDYISRARPLETKHSHLQRIGVVGRVIHGIEYYFESDSVIGKESILSKDSYPFSLRVDVHLNDLEYYKNHESATNLKEPNIFTENLKEIFAEGFYELDWFIYVKERHIETYDNYPFNDLIVQFRRWIKSFHRDLDHPDVEFFKNVTQKVFLEYERLLSLLPKGTFMPGYLDFSIPYSNQERAMINALEHTAGELISNKLEEVPLHRLIRARYEIIKHYKSITKFYKDWPILLQALVLLTYFERIMFKSTIDELTKKLLNDVRCIVYSSDSNMSLDRQHDSLDIQDLSRILRDFQFKKGLNKTFNIEGYQLIDVELYKYPEPHAVKNLATEKEIEEILSHIIHEEILHKYYINLYFMPY